MSHSNGSEIVVRCRVAWGPPVAVGVDAIVVTTTWNCAGPLELTCTVGGVEGGFVVMAQEPEGGAPEQANDTAPVNPADELISIACYFG